ncbi:MAG: caspase family protein [Rhodospirillaceae bacterium]|jgi:hypothetical protein|nr:caspase family protein [Rhodospirillales bacterium]MBT3905374.1 caspase family protein [Rhodospirillaceae bacterium]MBT4703750.1 caspase family protein [Rhodospirillaceae bacterium]MBT5033826.1 caspase family protein [Rhodospirillaceae bacterium]MBT6222134.1 caspase family protein [Rhodospirillaceae bacterium]
MGVERVLWMSVMAFVMAATIIDLPVADAASRGLSVQLRTSEAKNAPVAGEVKLYSQSYALIIGIDAYTNGWPRLSNAVKDAELVAVALRNKGFDVTLKTNLKSTEFKSVFEEFFVIKGKNPEARLFVWFAGHGHTIDGEGYLVPADAPRADADETYFKLRSLPLRTFGTYARQANAKHVFNVFDSCFAGTVFNAQRSLPPAAITRATVQPVRQFLTSGDADQVVSDDGRFRRLFLRALKGGERVDANADGYVTGSEMGMFLTDRLTNLTKAKQTPRYGKLNDDQYDRGDFVFKLASVSPVPITGRTLSSAPTQSVDREALFWQSIKNSRSPADFGDYLEKFPNGIFTSLAQRRLTALSSETRLKANGIPEQEGKPTEQAQRKLFETLLTEGDKAMRQHQKTASVNKFKRALTLYPNDRKAQERLNQAKKLVDLCGKIAGDWNHDWGFGVGDVTLSVNGKAYSRFWLGNNSGQWKCVDGKSGKFVIGWSSDNIETVQMLANGNEFKGVNNLGVSVHGTRRGSPEAEAKLEEENSFLNEDYY